jgi:hypothetical protein
VDAGTVSDISRAGTKMSATLSTSTEHKNSTAKLTSRVKNCESL